VEIRTEIAALQRQTGLTTLYVPHDQVEAMTLGHRVAVLNQGRLQQFAPPQEIYDRPANTFVADFIGTPSMNLWPARLRRRSEGAEVSLGQHWLPIPTDHPGAAAATREGAEVIAGLRPEAFQPAGAAPSAPRIPMPVSTTEALGHEVIVLLHPEPASPSASTAAANAVPAKPFAARLPADQPPTAGQSIALAMLCQRLHRFHPDGTALTF